MRPMYIGRHAPPPDAPPDPRHRVTAESPRAWREATPHAPPSLGADAAHVWRVRLNPPGDMRDAWDLLSDEEQGRGRRFIQERHRRRFVAAHAALRRILAGYTARPARELTFTAGQHGKPALV